MSSIKHVHLSQKHYQEASIETWTLPSPNELTRDLKQLGRHRRRRRLRQCDLIDCITLFQSEFEKSFISCSVLVKFTCSLHFFAT